MEKRTQIKTVICGVALAALFSARPALSQEGDPCTFLETENPCITLTFSPTQETNKYDFGTHFIKITANVLRNFDLSIEFVPITQDELNARLNTNLIPANCVPYAGATSNTPGSGFCGFYHVLEPLPVKDVDYTGDVLYKVFWDFPTLDQLHNVRLYRAPIPEEDPQTCENGSECYTQDITDAVYAVGDSHTADPGVSGKGTGFSDYEVVDLTSLTSTAARVWIGLKDNSGGLKNHVEIRFDLRAVVRKNGLPVSAGSLLGALGGSPGFGNANLRTIPLSLPLPASAFASGDTISMELFVRNSCVGSSDNSGTARLWFNDAAANSRVDEPGVPTRVPTLYLVMPGTTLDLSSSSGRGKKTKDAFVGAPDPSCNGSYTSFGTWSGTVPY